MNGAEAILKTLADNEVEVCFSNPGTSEMQMVSAFDREPRVRPVLCLFEGVATGAADGYARMAGKPGSTLLHLGAGLANGSANLHNARRAYSPIVNIVGDVTQRFPGRPVVAIIGGLHLFAASDAQVAWTARSLRKAGVRYLLGAHCTGIEAVYQLRKGLALDRHSAVVGAVGASFNVADGIHPGRLAQ